MTDLSRSRFIRALLRQPVDRTPIWLMRQAGRYLPEYRLLRSKTKNFFTFCETPELACEATLQPLRRFSLDAAIIFSDILTVPRAMGCDIQMSENAGPIASHPIRDQQAIRHLEACVVEKLCYVSEAIQLTRKELDSTVPLIGFAGSPWTVATYMVEGGASKTFEIIKSMLYKAPGVLHQLLQKLTDATISYLTMQINAGADVIMLFDSWGGVLSQKDYREFSLRYMVAIAEALDSSLHTADGNPIPLIFFSKGCGLYLQDLIGSGCDAIGLDWTVDLVSAKKITKGRVALQGNLDPTVLLASPAVIQAEAKNILDVYQRETGFVFNLGHGILKNTPTENVAALVEYVTQY